MALKGQKYLKHCKVFDDLQKAIIDCDLVLASFGRINVNPNKTKNIFKNSLLKSLSAAVDEDVDTKNSLYVTIVIKKFKKSKK